MRKLLTMMLLALTIMSVSALGYVDVSVTQTVQDAVTGEVMTNTVDAASIYPVGWPHGHNRLRIRSDIRNFGFYHPFTRSRVLIY